MINSRSYDGRDRSKNEEALDNITLYEILNTYNVEALADGSNPQKISTYLMLISALYRPTAVEQL